MYKVVCNTLLYMVFKYSLEPVLIKQILIGFKSLLTAYKPNYNHIVRTDGRTDEGIDKGKAHYSNK